MYIFTLIRLLAVACAGLLTTSLPYGGKVGTAHHAVVQVLSMRGLKSGACSERSRQALTQFFNRMAKTNFTQITACPCRLETFGQVISRPGDNINLVRLAKPIDIHYSSRFPNMPVRSLIFKGSRFMNDAALIYVKVDLSGHSKYGRPTAPYAGFGVNENVNNIDHRECGF